MEGTNTMKRLKGTCGDLEMVVGVVRDGDLSSFFPAASHSLYTIANGSDWMADELPFPLFDTL